MKLNVYKTFKLVVELQTYVEVAVIADLFMKFDNISIHFSKMNQYSKDLIEEVLTIKDEILIIYKLGEDGKPYLSKA